MQSRPEGKCTAGVLPHEQCCRGIVHKQEGAFVAVLWLSHFWRAFIPRYGSARCICLIWLAVLLGVSGGLAQQVRLTQLDHTAWTTRDGAPLNVSSITQDPDGTLWLAAESGLYIFNGLSFFPFHSQSTDPPLPSTQIADLHTGNDGSLWVGFTIRGIARIKNHHVIRVYGEKDGLLNGQVSQILNSPDGGLITVVRNRLFRLRYDHWEELHIGLVSSDEIKRVFFDRSGYLWLATNAAIWKLTPGEQQATKTTETGGMSSQFHQASDGSVWYQFNNPGPAPGSTRRLLGDKDFSSARASIPGDGYDFLFDSSGLLWIATQSDGIHRVLVRSEPRISANSADGSADQSAERFGSVNGLTSDETDILFEDRAGDIWVGTALGLDRFRKPHLIRTVDKRIGPHTALAQCPGGDLWLAGQAVPPQSMHDGRIEEHGPTREPTFAHCDAKGVLWLSEDQGLWRYQGEQIKRIPPPPGVPAINNREIVGNDDRLLFASYTRQGLWRFVNGTWSRVETPGFPVDTPYSLFMDRGGRLWAGFIDNRIGLLDGARGHTFEVDSTHPLGIVQVFLESSFGLLAGGSNGIAVLAGDHFRSLRASDETRVEGVSGLLQSPNGDLWLNALHGIVHIHADEVANALKFPSYQMHSEVFSEAGIVGPSPQVFCLPSAVQDSRGIFWFATSNRIVSIDPESVHPSSTPPTLGLLSATVDGSPLEADHHVNPGYHTIRIKYFGAYITAPEKVTYKYKLAGVNQDWQDVNERSEAVYTGLRPGKYRFAVAASNGEGAWSQPDESLQFTVKPSFYQTTTFLLLCVGGAFAVFLTGLRMRVRSVAATVRKSSEARADERIQIARDLHDTLLQGVQGLMLRFHVAAQELPRESVTRQSLESALLTAQRVVIEGRERVSRLRAGDSQQVDLPEAFKSFAAEWNDENAVVFLVQAVGRQTAIKTEVRQELLYIGREAITNAFAHAGASEIEVSLRFETKYLTLAVKDNGKGFDTAGVTSAPRAGHWGFAGMKERAATIGARFQCLSQEGCGTQVLVIVPARQAYEGAPSIRAEVKARATNALKLLRGGESENRKQAR